jgi:sigma-B regulation protein RsbU (phosphoserine phosphatase)
MSKTRLKRWINSLQTKSTLAIIITAGVLLEVTSAVQYFYARNGIRKEVRQRAENELRIKSLEIRNVLTAVEVAIENVRWEVEKSLAYPDSMWSIGQRLVEHNPVIVGCSPAFEPNYYPSKGHYFEPYTVRNADGTIDKRQIGSAQHDYLQAEWYTATKQSGRGHWSEPYYDDAGALMMLCTYAVPIRDAAGAIVGVLGADVSLEWLGSVINAHNFYPSSFNLLLSRTGQLMVCPVESLVLKRTIQDMTAGMEDTVADAVNRQMLDGKSGYATVRENDGKKNYVFFAPVDTLSDGRQDSERLGWSMAIVCSDREIFYSLRQVGFNLMLLMIAGLALLAFIISRTIRGFNRLQAVTSEKERIGSELRIASNIQMGMLPKTFPPFPDRDDVEVYGSVVPAKEVGGDLFDFFIRDEKMFFCIGDVSGKGVPASLVMAVTRSLFRTVSAHESAPDRVVTQLNDAMADMNDSNMFVTFFLGVLDLPTGRLRYCNAGHDAPLLVGRGVGRLPVESNIPLGVMPGWKYTSQEVIVNPHTTIFLYTDGLTEAEDGNHQQFGEERLMAVARQELAAGRQLPKTLIENMSAEVHQFVGDAEQSDDLTMLAIQYTKEQRAESLNRSITLPNDVGEVPRLATFVDEVCETLGIDGATTMQMNLALEEAVVNVMNYAYPPGTPGEVVVEAHANDVRLKFIISDSGVPFDPTAKGEVDTTLSVEERGIGGLGIHLVRQIMDSMNYERVDGRNILTLRKKLM